MVRKQTGGKSEPEDLPLQVAALPHVHTPAPLPPGNCNLVYAIIRKRNVFHQLANLPSDSASIQKALQRKRKSPDVISRTSSQETVSMEGSHPAVPAEPGTLKASLVAMPGTGSTSSGKVVVWTLTLTAAN